MIPPHAELDSAEELGWSEFTEGVNLARALEVNAGAPPDGLARGWWLAYARHFARGFAFAVTRVSAQEMANAANPYGQFSPAWEAWAAGFEQGVEAQDD